MLVSVRKVEIHPTRAGVAVTVTPSKPYGPLLVEDYLRERFGWWPVARARLDYVSEADSACAVARPAFVWFSSTRTAGRRSRPAAPSACARTEQHAEVVRHRGRLAERIEQHTSLAAPVEQEDVERVVGIRSAGP